MRIAYCKLSGYKRFENATVNLDRNLLAFVGPNEAGKTSLFQALASVENNNPFSSKELSRNQEFDDGKKIIELVYFIEKADLEKLIEFNGIGEPKQYHLFKAKNGDLTHELSGKVRRDIRLRVKLSTALSDLLKVKSYNKSFTAEILEEEDYEDKSPAYTLFDETEEVISVLESKSETLTDSELEELNEFKTHINSFLSKTSKAQINRIGKIAEDLKDVIASETKEHPKTLFTDYIFAQKPKIAFFDTENRNLKEVYSLKEINDPPAALKNILSVANINHKDLYDSIHNKKSGLQETILEDGNIKLKEQFIKYWNQAQVYPRLKLENSEIRILIKFVDTYNNLSDRSDGLKQFITLLAFALNSSHEQSKLVLLIDEAEIHLHYAAQADIVELFEKQKLVNSIYYSTHSAGCLPSDLGTGIRAVEPLKDEQGSETAKSKIRNSVWVNTSGFSPILMAMGASVIAFSLTRKALIAEGPSETILLPRLLREASEQNNLDFQIAPGLATISTEKCKELELEAPKVVYLVDGDGGGIAIKDKLINGGINSLKIICLPEGHSLEDFVSKNQLLNSVNKILNQFHKPQLETEVNMIPDEDSLKFLKSECNNLNVELPSKVLIAEDLVLIDRSIPIINKKKKAMLKKVFKEIMKAIDR